MLGEVNPRSQILPIEHAQPLNSSLSEFNYPFLLRSGFLILLRENRMIIKIPQVLAQRARSSSSHYRDIQNGLFTKPVNLGERAVGWPTSEVNILTAAQVAGLTGDEIRSLVVELHLKRKSVFSTLMEV